MNKFITEMIVSVTILIRLNKNINKISILDVNVSNFLLEKNVINFFLFKCQYVPLDQNVNIIRRKMSVVSFLGLNIRIFLLE